MQRLSTTVVAVVGPGSDDCLRSLEDARNVAAVRVPVDDPAGRAMEAWSRCVRSRSLYTVHDADPLEAVADAWGQSFSAGPRGSLEVAVAEAQARSRAESIGLPDFYLVLRPDDLSSARRDWYLGVLHRAAPHRVLPVESETGLVRDAIAGLGSGRWWPALDDLLTGLEHDLPDQMMAGSDHSLSDDAGDASNGNRRLVL